MMQIKNFKDLVRLAPKELQQVFWQQWKAPQNPIYHPEGNTLKHIAVVVTRAIQQYPNDIDMILAAFFHDLGKFFTLDYKNNIPTAHGHEKISIKFVDKFGEWIKSLGGDVEKIKYIVENHMKIKPNVWDVMKQTKKNKITQHPEYEKLNKFGGIDKGGLKEIVNRMINEELNDLNRQFYHGTRTPLPFIKFDPKMIGTGIVSSSKPEYGGFFFTDNKENAEFYTEWFVCTVRIDNLIPVESKNPPMLMKQAIVDRKNYLSVDVLDGAFFSDVAVVPSSNINSIHIVNWEFVGDQESYFEYLDEIFGGDDDDYVNQDMINDTLSMIEMDINYLLKIPIFKNYFDSK